MTSFGMPASNRRFSWKQTRPPAFRPWWKPISAARSCRAIMQTKKIPGSDASYYRITRPGISVSLIERARISPTPRRLSSPWCARTGQSTWRRCRITKFIALKSTKHYSIAAFIMTRSRLANSSFEIPSVFSSIEYVSINISRERPLNGGNF